MLASVKVKNFNISVVIPALNAEDYLPGLLEKIESQTLIPKEIIIVDSSLSKKTADIIEKWKGRYRLFTKEWILHIQVMLEISALN